MILSTSLPLDWPASRLQRSISSSHFSINRHDAYRRVRFSRVDHSGHASEAAPFDCRLMGIRSYRRCRCLFHACAALHGNNAHFSILPLAWRRVISFYFNSRLIYFASIIFAMASWCSGLIYRSGQQCMLQRARIQASLFSVSSAAAHYARPRVLRFGLSPDFLLLYGRYDFSSLSRSIYYFYLIARDFLCSIC